MNNQQIFFSGIVEDNNDPLKLFRCRVRIFGIHTENKSDSNLESYIPVEDLPWADVLMTGSGIDGQGEFTPIIKGSTVIISFLDSENQRPIIIGTLPRFVAELPNFEGGFSDPDQIHPKQENLNESTISRLARNEKINQTIIQDKIDAVKTSVDCNGVTWDEPQTAYNTIYPNNRIIQTKNHIFEMDDSDGVERVHIYHKSGSCKEFHPNGDVVDVIKNKKFTIIISDDNILIEGNNNIHINGNQNIFIEGSENEKIGVDNNKDIELNQNITIGGSQDVQIGGSQNIDIVGNIDESATDQTIILGGSQNITAASTINLTASTINLDGVVNINGSLNAINGSAGVFSGNITMDGILDGPGSINLNGNINSGGNISSDGSIIDASGNTNHHSH